MGDRFFFPGDKAAVRDVEVSDEWSYACVLPMRLHGLDAEEVTLLYLYAAL
jgi:hypothetical protein